MIEEINFFKAFKIKKHRPFNEILNEPVKVGRVFQKYQKHIANSKRSFNLVSTDNEFPFPEKWYKSIGYTIRGFCFTFNNVPNNVQNILNPSANLINDRENNNIELADKTFTKELFFDEQPLLDKIAEYKAIPTKDFINESFFLNDKSNTIKKTFISALNKQLSIYGSFSYFSGNTSKKKT